MARISARQPSGESTVLEVTPETTGCELKQQIKLRENWDDLTSSTTSVEIVLEDNQLLANDAKVLDCGIAEDSAVTVVFKSNRVVCTNKDAITSFGGILDSELLLVVEIPNDQAQIVEHAFEGCRNLARLTIPNSVTQIGACAFADCSSLVDLTIPDSVTHIGPNAFTEVHWFGGLNHPQLSDPH